MRCQNCGFESEDKICSFCGAEIVEIQEEESVTEQQVLSDNSESQTEELKTQKPKKSIKKILLAVLITVLSAAVVSASSVAIYSFAFKSDKSIFNKINQTVDCGDFSVTLKDVKTPEFDFEYYPQIIYDAVFEFYNNTNKTLELIKPVVVPSGYDSLGYFYVSDNDFYEVNDAEIRRAVIEIPAWSSVDVIERVRYEDYSDYSSSGFSYSLADEASDDEADIIIFDGVINVDGVKFKKEDLQNYKNDSPDGFYLILSTRNKGSDEERKYARFFIEPDKEAIVIPEDDYQIID